jgi:hypothetical protein
MTSKEQHNQLARALAQCENEGAPCFVRAIVLSRFGRRLSNIEQSNAVQFLRFYIPTQASIMFARQWGKS